MNAHKQDFAIRPDEIENMVATLDDEFAQKQFCTSLMMPTGTNHPVGCIVCGRRALASASYGGCSRCRGRMYCSDVCQDVDWTLHRQDCDERMCHLNTMQGATVKSMTTGERRTDVARAMCEDAEADLDEGRRALDRGRLQDALDTVEFSLRAGWAALQRARLDELRDVDLVARCARVAAAGAMAMSRVFLEVAELELYERGARGAPDARPPVTQKLLSHGRNPSQQSLMGALYYAREVRVIDPTAAVDALDLEARVLERLAATGCDETPYDAALLREQRAAVVELVAEIRRQLATFGPSSLGVALLSLDVADDYTCLRLEQKRFHDELRPASCISDDFREILTGKTMNTRDRRAR